MPVCSFGRAPVALKRREARPFAWFGLPVAADGTTIVVGAPLEGPTPYETSPLLGKCDALKMDAPIHGAGMVRVFERSNADFTETPLPIDGIEDTSPIVPNDMVPFVARPGVYRSMGLAISGDWIAVGLGGDGNHAEFQGSVRLFHRVAGKWTALVGRVENPNGRAGDLYGATIALAENTLVVGAPGEDDSASRTTNSGAAYVYTLGDDGPGPPTRITSAAPQSEGWFAASVTVSSDYIVIGAPLEDDTATDDGMVYVFEKDGSPAYSIRPDSIVKQYFGASLAARGDQLAVGAPFASPDRAYEGAVRLFRLTPGGASTVWTRTNPKPDGIFFGMSVALGGHGLVVGMPFAPTASARADAGHGGLRLGPGTAYVFERDASGAPSSSPCLLLSPFSRDCDGFGDWVAASDDLFIVPSPRSDVEDGTTDTDARSALIEDTGATYVYSAVPR